MDFSNVKITLLNPLKNTICYYISYSGNLFNILKVIKYGSLNHSIYTNYYKVGLV